MHIETVLPWGRVHLRPLWDVSANTLRLYKVGSGQRYRPPHGAVCYLSTAAHEALKWWLNTLDSAHLPSRPLFQLSTQGRLTVWNEDALLSLPPPRPLPTAIARITVDASYAGWGAVIGPPTNPGMRLAGLWPDSIAQCAQGFQEAWGILQAVSTLARTYPYV